MTYARVVAITKPIVNECETAGDFIAYAARVSNPANQANKETASKLLDYLKRNKHWSPFEMASATVEIVTTRDIARQILRHRSFAFQEFSQRYADATADPIIRDARLQDIKNRQNSIKSDDKFLHKCWQEAQLKVYDNAMEVYQTALKNGIAKEVARSVLPEGMTQSRLYMAGSFRSWLHYLEVREDPSTQLEHREVANAIRAELAKHSEIF